MTAPVDNLVRALVEPDAAALRAQTAEGDGRTLYGHFAVFDRWTEINSIWEGNFLERIAPGAFASTIAERRDQVKVLYDHGKDPQLGNKPLGPIVDLREDNTGVYYEVRLLDTSYNNDFVIPAASEGLLGASFRFRVTSEDWVEPKTASRSNPAKLPERTITAVDLYEFGPVTFPAYAAASAGVRSDTDEFFDRLRTDPLFLARFTERVGLRVVEPLIAAFNERGVTEVPVEDADDVASDTETARSDETQPPAPTSPPPPSTKEDRAKRLRQIEMSRLGIKRT